jgi:pimeloyl-ACP methyl ester carboxylesterase
MKRPKKWIIIAGIFILLLVALQVGRQYFREEEWRVRHFIYTQVKEKFPEAAEKLMAGYGVSPFKPVLTAERPHWGKAPEKRPVAILIHGLDEPGKVWMNLAPALWEEGFNVLIMTYPNDQPVEESARYFCDQMVSFFSRRPQKVLNLAIVGHSMGGLVAREMLTSPKLAYGEKLEKGQIPKVETFIMVGTPNHGSQLAQFRFFTEIRDQFHQMFYTDSHWLNGLLDGAGEAGIDLIPGSRFLTRLNSRPLPEHLNMQVIAGIVNPWSEDEIQTLIRYLEKGLPPETRPASRALEETLLSMSRTIGDGLVSVDSAKLKGVPLKTVQGTHLTMIRNISASNPRIPPAVPLILEMLAP